MKIVHLSNDLYKPVVPKKTTCNLRLDRCMLMISNQRIKDKIRAEQLFAKRLDSIKIKLKDRSI